MARARARTAECGGGRFGRTGRRRSGRPRAADAERTQVAAGGRRRPVRPPRVRRRCSRSRAVTRPCIEVGKQARGRSVAQERIHELMLEHARAGRRVVRLKGGDPFIFGRGGEELEFLAAHGIPFEVVPGITAAAACGAYSGIPLTHREHAQSVQFVTAHRSESLPIPANGPRWPRSGRHCVSTWGWRSSPWSARSSGVARSARRHACRRGRGRVAPGPARDAHAPG